MAIRSLTAMAVCASLVAIPVSAAGQSPGGSGDEVLDLTFDDIKFDMEKDEEFSSDMLTDAINDLEGKRISLRGYVLPSTRQSGITAFVLVRDNQECCFGPGAALFDCVLVKLREKHEIDYTVRPVTVEGQFMIRPYTVGDRVMAVFRMKDCTVSQ
jgi:hypothetical protein